MVSELKQGIIQCVEDVKKNNPMVGSVTNTVTINFVANAQIAVGGSASCVYMPDEAETLVEKGDSFYINLGTILPIYEDTLPQAGRLLSDTHKNWVLDPVAVGIGSLRTRLLRQFNAYKPTIIKGNASEMLALAGLWGLEGGQAASKVRGVDSTELVEEATEAAKSIAEHTEGVCVVSGKEDLITDGRRVVRVKGGHEILANITGSGCALGGVIAIYATQVEDPFIAALTGVQVFKKASEKAAADSQGPGTFQARFLDYLHNLTPEEIADNEFELVEE